jgi:hypothetical protein
LGRYSLHLLHCFCRSRFFSGNLGFLSVEKRSPEKKTVLGVGVLAVQFVPNSLELISIERNRRKGFIPDYSRGEKAENIREKSGAKG